MFHSLTLVIALSVLQLAYLIGEDAPWLGLLFVATAAVLVVLWHRALEERLRGRVPPVTIEPHITITHEGPTSDTLLRQLRSQLRSQPPAP